MLIGWVWLFFTDLLYLIRRLRGTSKINGVVDKNRLRAEGETSKEFTLVFILEKMQVLMKCDWERVLRQTRRSNSQIFWKCVFSGRSLVEELKPLLSPLVLELFTHLESILFPNLEGFETEAFRSNASPGLKVAHYWTLDTNLFWPSILQFPPAPSHAYSTGLWPSPHVPSYSTYSLNAEIANSSSLIQFY